MPWRSVAELLYRGATPEGLLLDTLDIEYELCQEFKSFSASAIVYACIEYSKHGRGYTEKQRCEYLLRKCKEFVHQAGNFCPACGIDHDKTGTLCQL